MATLDRGIRINSDNTQVLLNNQLFETSQGSLLFTTRIAPPSPLPAVGSTQEVVLLDGGTGGYIKVRVIYGPNGFHFKVDANPTSGSGPSSVTPPTPVLPYNQEVTLGAVYNATTGLLASRTSADAQVFGSPSNPPWVTTGGDEDAGVDPTSIGLSKFNGFIGKLATYSKAFSTSGVPSELDSFVANPNLWPSTDRLHLLDGTQVLGASWVNVARPETQSLTFGNAAATGLINVGGIEILVQQGDSGPVVAEKVQAKLVADNLYKVQAEKQNLTFEPLTGTGTTTGSILVDGVTVTLTNVNSEAAIAADVQTALKAAYAATASAADQKLRIVQKNADNSVTITFAASEGNANLVPVSSGTSGVAVSVDTVLPYSASALGRTVTRDGNKLLITFNRYDENIENFATNAPYAKFLVNPGSTGVTVSSQESIAHIPSEFIFAALPQGKVQKISIVADAGGTSTGDASKVSITNAFTNDGTATAVHVTVNADASSSKTKLAELVAQKLTEAAAATQTVGNQVYPSKIKEAKVDPTNAEAVLVTFHPDAGQQAHVVFFAGAASPAKANIATVSNFAQGARGEIQSVSFANGTGNFVIDGQAVSFTGSGATTASQAATQAKAALEKKSVVEEVKTLTFSEPTPALAGSPKVIVFGHEIPVVANASATVIATAVKQYFSNGSATGITDTPVDKKILAASPFSAVSVSGSTVTFNYKTTVAHPDNKSLWTNNGGVTATVAQTTAFNGNTYSTGAVQTLNLKTLDPGISTLRFDATNGTTVLSSGNILLGGSGPFTANEVALQVAGALQAQIGQSGATSLGNLLSAVVPDGDSIHFYFKNSVGQPSSDQTIKAFGVGDSTTFTGIQGFDATSGLATLLPTGTVGYPATTTQFYNAEGRHKLSVNGDVLRIEFSSSEDDVKPVLVDTTGSSVKAAVSTLQLHHVNILSTAGYDGGGGGSAANVLYAQLKDAASTRSTANALLDERKVIVDVFVDRSKAVTAANDFGTGFESVSFMLSYDPALMKDADPVVTIPASASGSAVFNVNRQAGEITIRVVDNASVSDLSKAVASVEFVQRKTGADFAPRMNVEFKNVDIDGINFTGGSFNSSFSSSVNLDRWEVSSQLVNALQPTTGIGGQLVAFYGSPTLVPGQPLSLKLASNGLTNVGGGAPTLASSAKTVTLDLVNNVAGTTQAAMVLTLPSNLTAASFTPATGVTATSSLNGRLLEVNVTNAGSLPASGKIGTVTVSVTQAEGLTHEFGFLPGSVVVNNQANAAGGQALYAGYTRTDANGNWTAKDMPKGDFNKVAFPTAATNAAKVVTAADALEILKLSAGFVPTWIGSNGELLSAAYVAADVDRSGNVTAQDALLALRHAAATLGNDPMTWRFIDASTRGLGVNNASPSLLNQGLQISGNEGTVNINQGSNPDFQVKALLVGNLTQPAAGEYVV